MLLIKRQKLSWDYDIVMRLIVKYKNRPVLWKLNYPGYDKRVLSTKAIKQLASMFGGDKSNLITTPPAHLYNCADSELVR